MPTKSAEQSKHPIRRRFTPPSRRLLLSALGLAGLAGIGTALYLNSRVTVPYFSWAKAQGWDVQPVRVVRLEPKWLMRFERVPDDPSPQELAVFRTSWNAWWSGNVRYYVKDKPTVALRQAYERVLVQYPHFFYTEYAIADWYRENNDGVHYHAWLEQSLRDAPAVLAGRVVYDNGKPAANVTCSVRITVQCKKGLDNHTMIGWYLTATTDSEGCYYLPVFKGIYSTVYEQGLMQDAVTDAQGRQMNLYRPGSGFSEIVNQDKSHARLVEGAISVSRVGVLPTMIARRKIQIILPVASSTASPQHPVLVTGNVLNLAWTPVPGAVRYQVSIGFEGVGRSQNAICPPDPHFLGGSPDTHVQLPLNGLDAYDGKAPLMDRNTSYGVTIWAHGSTDPANYNDLLSASSVYYFRPLNATAPLPVTKANIVRVLGTGTQVFSIIKTQDTYVVSGSVSTQPYNLLTPEQISSSFGMDSQGLDYQKVIGDNQQEFTLEFARRSR